MVQIFLDTNFLLIPGRLNVDVFSFIRTTVPEQGDLFLLEESLRELQNIEENKKSSQADRQAARLGIVLAKQQHLKMVKGFGNCDELLLKFAKKGDYVATQDKELKRRLRENGVHILSLRQKKYIMIEN